MSSVKEFEGAGTTAVRQLRLKKFKHGRPFMINSKELPGNQCYLEYSDGKIQLVTISSASRDFTILRELSTKESSLLRTKFKLERF